MEFERLNHIRHVYVLGCYLQRDGVYHWKERRPGDGSGLPPGQTRIEIVRDDPFYWRIWAEISERRGWGS